MADLPLIHGVTAGGAKVPVQVAADGTMQVSSGGGGGSSNVDIVAATGLNLDGSNNVGMYHDGAVGQIDAADISNYLTITVIGAADVAGTLYYDFSADGATAIRNVQLSSGLTADLGIHSLVRVARYGRVRLVNGASAQSSLSLQTLIQPFPAVAQPTSRAFQTISDFSDVLNVRLLGDPRLDKSNGRHANRTTIEKFGFNPDVAASTEEDVWAAGGTYNWLTAADTVRIASGGNVNDTAAGTGARSITIVGLDSNWDEATETIATAGGSASSATSTSFIRVFRAFVATSGTYNGANTGDVTIETSGGTTVAFIVAARGQTQLAIYTVPDGFNAFLRRVQFNSDSSKVGQALVYQRQDADTTSAPFSSKRLVFNTPLSGLVDVHYETYPGPFPARTDLWCAAIGGSGGMAVSAEMDIVLIRL